MLGKKGRNRNWRKLLNKEFDDPCALSNFSRVFISRMMIWARHVACMKEGEETCKVADGRCEK